MVVQRGQVVTGYDDQRWGSGYGPTSGGQHSQHTVHHYEPAIQSSHVRTVAPTVVEVPRVGLPVVQEWAASPSDGTGCASHCANACCCSLCPKIGNMTPLLQTVDKHTGKPKIWCMVGPFWPVLIFITCPLILGISGLLAAFILPKLHMSVGIVLALLVLITMGALCATACVDPGLIVRHAERPAVGGENWYFSDVAKTFRPPRAAYCHMCRVVVQDMDHVCPWTGTAIAKNNMPYFLAFTRLVCVLIVCEFAVLSYGLVEINK